MTFRMTLAANLASELDTAVERVPTALGPPVLLELVTAIGPSLTVLATSVFSSGIFRAKVQRWCKKTTSPIEVTASAGDETLLIRVEARIANVMATQIATLTSQFIEMHADGTANSRAKEHSLP